MTILDIPWARLNLCCGILPCLPDCLSIWLFYLDFLYLVLFRVRVLVSDNISLFFLQMLPPSRFV
ncbi:hypothetical protein L873DRAFT_630061 [Choiromyces venosus 120613-1]|uniref:Uncharacterized protein n=1 Tax=Choiromyces venosus 120613-1 TaxID=1336337 RepID=A0A3N4JXI2_9PEZI|nr:hypothetical protein L873DRAFT_630061 [Choiromyces venosus 120613-1]